MKKNEWDVKGIHASNENPSGDRQIKAVTMVGYRHRHRDSGNKFLVNSIVSFREGDGLFISELWHPGCSSHFCMESLDRSETERLG
jgi:hypothetical protein